MYHARPRAQWRVVRRPLLSRGLAEPSPSWPVFKRRIVVRTVPSVRNPSESRGLGPAQEGVPHRRQARDVQGSTALGMLSDSVRPEGPVRGSRAVARMAARAIVEREAPVDGRKAYGNIVKRGSGGHFRDVILVCWQRIKPKPEEPHGEQTEKRTEKRRPRADAIQCEATAPGAGKLAEQEGSIQKRSGVGGRGVGGRGVGAGCDVRRGDGAGIVPAPLQARRVANRRARGGRGCGVGPGARRLVGRRDAEVRGVNGGDKCREAAPIRGNWKTAEW